MSIYSKVRKNLLCPKEIGGADFKFSRCFNEVYFDYIGLHACKLILATCHTILELIQLSYTGTTSMCELSMIDCSEGSTGSTVI